MQCTLSLSVPRAFDASSPIRLARILNYSFVFKGKFECRVTTVRQCQLNNSCCIPNGHVKHHYYYGKYMCKLLIIMVLRMFQI